MIDKEDFPIRTPQEYLAHLHLFLGSGNSAATPAAKKAESERIERLYQKYIVAKENLDLKAMSLEELLERFEEISLVESEIGFEPQLSEELQKFIESQCALESVDQELRARGVESRRALLRFYEHDNQRVQLNAATCSYAVAPEAARRVLENLLTSVVADVFFEVTRTLQEFDDGVLIPD